MEFADKIEFTISAIKSAGFEIDDERAEKIVKYCDLVAEKNKVMNLTRVDSFEEMIPRHIIDSLSLLECVEIRSGEKVIDLGTGAGLPGMPVRIMLPSIDMTLVDSVGKKVDFVNEAITAIGLDNCRAIHNRAEMLGREKQHREKYGICVSRAVSDLAALLEYCLPLVRVGGRFIAYKADDCAEELERASKAMRILGGEIEKIHEYEVGCVARKLIVIKKISKTPQQYPRKAGTPSKTPIVD